MLKNVKISIAPNEKNPLQKIVINSWELKNKKKGRFLLTKKLNNTTVFLTIPSDSPFYFIKTL